MSTSRENQEKLQLQQLEQANGGVLLKNIFGIYANHPWLSILFVILFALFTNSLFEVLACIYGDPSSEPTFRLPVILTISGFLFLLLALVFLTVWRLHYGSVRQKGITEKKVLVSLVSAYKKDIKETPSYNVIDALIYNEARQPQQSLLEEVVFIATEERSTQAAAEKLSKYVEKNLGRKSIIKVISVNEEYPDEIKRQLTLVLRDTFSSHAASDIICDYTGGTKNMSIALHALAKANFVTAVYLYEAMQDHANKRRSK